MSESHKNCPLSILLTINSIYRKQTNKKKKKIEWNLSLLKSSQNAYSRHRNLYLNQELQEKESGKSVETCIEIYKSQILNFRFSDSISTSSCVPGWQYNVSYVRYTTWSWKMCFIAKKNIFKEWRRKKNMQIPFLNMYFFSQNSFQSIFWAKLDFMLACVLGPELAHIFLHQTYFLGIFNTST